MTDYETYKQALKDVTKPCAFLDVDLLNKNIHDITSRSNGKRIRIASKSIRSVPVLKDILRASPIFQGVMCFTAEEAVYLSDQELDDLLVAYPVWDTHFLKQIVAKRKDDRQITLMIDSTEHIDHLERIAKNENCTFLVCMDIDLSTDYPRLHFGVHRSPIKTSPHALAIAKRIQHSKYLVLDGVMGYEAQIAGVTDRAPNQKLKNTMVRMLKKHSSGEIMKKRAEIIADLEAIGITPRFVNGGGTGSLHQTSLESAVTEVTIGSGFYSPGLFDYYEAFRFKPAVGFAIEITRIPAANLYTCAGGGYIGSGATGQDKQPHVYLPEGATLVDNEGAGEVQTPIHYEGKIKLQHGDPIFFRHSKAGELCKRFQKLHLIQDGEIIDTYTTYRGDHQCFL